MKQKSLEERIYEEIKKSKLSPEEAGKVLKNFQQINPKRYSTTKIDFPDRHIKFITFADAHMGHSCYRPDILRKMIKDGKRNHIEFYLNVGDTIEGMSGREGHIYELDHIGASQQLNYFSKEFSLFDKPVYSIEAQDSHGGWFRSKGNIGLNIGEELERRAKHYKFLGYDEQDLELDNGCKIKLRHPGGGTAYAVSYKMQKYIESMSGGKKPHLLFDGHFHKAMYMFYRNVHGFESGTLQEQSPFMKKINTPAHLGYWIVDINMYKTKKKGVERVKSEFVPFYE
jgi:hypothetical protein